jgi:flagellar basal-body rod protein FlgB
LRSDITAEGGAMLDRFLHSLNFQGNALLLRADRQRVLASNIANAETPGYKARDFDFAKALAQASSSPAGEGAAGPARSRSGHLAGTPGSMRSTTELALNFRNPEQASLDGNSVELDRERANFADNAVRYEATLRFINGGVRTMLSAIRGE